MRLEKRRRAEIQERSMDRKRNKEEERILRGGKGKTKGTMGCERTWNKG